MTELGPIIITAREVYDAVIVVGNKITDLSGEVRAVRKAQSESDDAMKDHEARLRSLEKARWPLPSLTVLIATAALVVAILFRH